MESEYDKKFKEMKKYIPFLENMIERLESSYTGNANPRQAQLTKIKSLRDLLKDNSKRMKMDNLMKCKQVLLNLHSKVEMKDVLYGIEKSNPSPSSSSSIQKDTTSVHQKLKVEPETLPEIARANQTEVSCSPGSKEPALFQRRPNAPQSPMKSPAKATSSSIKRNYTRVLVSPDRSRRWNGQDGPRENTLFHRRSPRKSPRRQSPKERRERKRSSKRETENKRRSVHSDGNLNITLNVPEERLHSLNTADIFDRILTCEKSDVDIKTLKDLRAQILGELKQTGKNEDISDLILQSYRNKRKKKKINKAKIEVEEGEISDSESEAIQSIYGSLVVVDKDHETGGKNKSEKTKTEVAANDESRKIQICLVISNSDKKNESSEIDVKTVDVDETEIHCEEIVPSPNKCLSSDPEPKVEAIIPLDDFDIPGNTQATPKTQLTESEKCTTLGDQIKSVDVKRSVESPTKPKGSQENAHPPKEMSPQSINDIQQNKVKLTEYTTLDPKVKNIKENEDFKLNENILPKQPATEINETKLSKTDGKIETEGCKIKQKNKANFYKPIVGNSKEKLCIDIGKDSNLDNISEGKVHKLATENEPNESKTLPDNLKNNNDDISVCKQPREKSPQIPFLSEIKEQAPDKKKEEISELDILQALKNEILSENISIPGSNTATPLLHQPKLTKVADVKDISAKKKISIEKYKEKSVASLTTPLYPNEPKMSSNKKDNSKKIISRGLTDKECERFNFPKLTLDDEYSDDEEDKTNAMCSELYDDLAPKSPDVEPIDDIPLTPVIIPEDPIKTINVVVPTDIDMRKMVPQLTHNQSNHENKNSLRDHSQSQTKIIDPRLRNIIPTSANDIPRLISPCGTSKSLLQTSSYPNMTPSRTPNRGPSMAPSVRTYELTPSHQIFESQDQQLNRKHVYAPTVWESGDITGDGSPDIRSPLWETSEKGITFQNTFTTSQSRRWEERDPRSTVSRDELQDNLTHSDSYYYKTRADRDPRLNPDRREESYSRIDCPSTPSHYFGSDIPTTPSHPFGRGDGSSTPIHHFGRNDGSRTPVHPFGRSDCSSTPNHPFDRGDCPSTPSHPFGRNEFPATPTYPYGVSDTPRTPSHPFGRSEYSQSTSHQYSRADCPSTPSHPFGRSGGFNKDPRYKRTDNTDQSYARDQTLNRNSYQSPRYKGEHSVPRVDTNKRDLSASRRESSVGCFIDTETKNDHSSRHTRSNSVSRSFIEEGMRCTDQRERSVDASHQTTMRVSRDLNVGKNYQDRDRSISRMSSESNYVRSTSRAPSVGRTILDHNQREESEDISDNSYYRSNRARSVGRSDRSIREQSIGRFAEHNVSYPATPFHTSKRVSVEAHAGRSITIDTSVNTTFQEYNFNCERNTLFDSRRKRASSVGRILIRENSNPRNIPIQLESNSKYAFRSTTTLKNNDFKRASSVGRELVEPKQQKSVSDIRADFESYRSKGTEYKLQDRTRDKSQNRSNSFQKDNCDKEIDTNMKYSKAKASMFGVDPRTRKMLKKQKQEEEILKSQYHNKQYNKDQYYSPRKNLRDPRMRKGRDKNYSPRDRSHSDDSRESRSRGIVYSNDNIAKGKILGPGYGVTNYKIPKIKRPEPEPVIEKPENKKPQIVPQSPKKLNMKDKSKSNTENECGRGNLKEAESLTNIPLKPRKSRKAVIYDSDLETDTLNKICGKNIDNKQTKYNNEPKNQEVSEIKQKVTEIADPSDYMETISNFDEDDFKIDMNDGELKLFAENVTSDDVIDNIDDLIADLDKDIGSSKNTENENIDLAKNPINVTNLDIFSPTDSHPLQNKSEATLEIQESLYTNQESDRSKSSDYIPDISTPPIKQTLELPLSMVPIDAKDTEKSYLEKKSENDIKSSTAEEPIETNNKSLVPAKESLVSDIIQKDRNDDVTTSVSNNEPVIDKSAEQSTNSDETTSIPDSTINPEDNSLLNKKEESTQGRLPDSTNEIHTDMHSDVSSTHDSNICSDKNANDCSRTSQQETKSEVDSLGSIFLGLLQDKSKIKELLNMFNANDKLKKKLEKLSELVSDEEEEHEASNVNAGKIIEQNINPDVQFEPSVGNSTKEQTETYEKENPPNEVVNNIPVANVDGKKRGAKKTIRFKRRNRQIKKANLKANAKAKRVTRSEVAQQVESKAKPKASRELELLRKDILEIYRGEEVFKATGLRTCRIAKLVDDKNSTTSSVTESTPSKLKSKPDNKVCSEDESEVISSGPIVVLEKFEDNLRDVKLAKQLKKKPGFNTETKQIISQPKEQLIQRIGPKSKTKGKLQVEKDPYLFESDSVTESPKKSCEVNESSSDNESLASSRSFNSTGEIKESKPKQRKKIKRKTWQIGVIKTKKGKKKVVGIENNVLEPSPVIKDVKVPDLSCFTDKTYCFSKGIISYLCKLCDFNGDAQAIVNHYRKNHPHFEIPLSRMDIKTANQATNQSMVTDFQEISKFPVSQYECRFCGAVFKCKRRKDTLESFFWHVVSTHTGEYKQICSECKDLNKCPFLLDIPPPPKDLRGLLMGYICGKCNYTQVSLENLKNHVSVRHNDEETEVYTISLNHMSQKMVDRLKVKASRDSSLRRSPRTTQEKLTRDIESEESDDEYLEQCSNKSENTNMTAKKSQVPAPVKSRISFENEDYCGKILKSETVDIPDRSEEEMPIDQNTDNEPVEDSINEPVQDSINEPDKDSIIEPIAESLHEQPLTSPVNNRLAIPISQRGEVSDVFVYPHFMLSFNDSGQKEYVCCINGNNHYKTSLLISMKKHVQLKHSEKWDGFCFVCKLIVTSQGQHHFKECLAHLLDKHMEEFPILNRVATTEEIQDVLEVSKSVPDEMSRTESPRPYINVRPLTDLISKPLTTISVVENPAQDEQTIPIIESVISLNSRVSQPQEPRETEPILRNDTFAYKKEVTPKNPFIDLKHEETQKEVMSKKHRIILDSMMSPTKLVQIFKCAGRFCSFTCDSLDDALTHTSTHLKAGGLDSMRCAYCSFDACGHPIDLVSHVFKEHGCCQYACKACFYRASTSSLVQAHFIRAHGQPNLGCILKAAVAYPVTEAEDRLLPRQEAVKYYICTHGYGTDKRCPFKAVLVTLFRDHFNQKHPQAGNLRCSECDETCEDATALEAHLKAHGLKLYQCTWCGYGAETESEMLVHASAKHPSNRPQAYMRYVMENKDGTSAVKSKFLPIVKFTTCAIEAIDVPRAEPDHPVREAERSVDLEKLIGHQPMQITENVASNSESTVGVTVTMLEQDEPINNSTLLTDESQQIEAQTIDQSDVASSIPVVSQILPPNTLGEQMGHIVKTEPKEKSSAAVEQTHHDSGDVKRNFVSDLIYSLDSEDDSNSYPDIIDLSEDNDSNQDPLTDTNTASNDIATNQELPNDPSTQSKAEIRFPLDKTYKCAKCHIVSESIQLFKRHNHICYQDPNELMSCAHCEFKTANKHEIANHYTTDHGPGCKYICGLCKFEHSTQYLIRKHFSTFHNITDVSIKLDKTNKSKVDHVFVVSRKVGPKRKRSTGPIAAPARKVMRYGPGDIKSLPINPILSEAIYCALCEYNTKVRLNLVRHLQAHEQLQPVPEIAPVNPVPHLETNEMHFDRMVNLASSSNANKNIDKHIRGENPVNVVVYISPERAAQYPKYVPQRQRYACGAKSCSYISIDEAMLKRHWDALHSEYNEFRCVHCPPTQQLDTSRTISAARILAHLKMHDVVLYACSSCPYYHHQYSIVQRHVTEKHKGNGSVQTVREQGANQAAPPTVQIAATATATTMDLKPWQCGLCKFKDMMRQAVIEHCSQVHRSKMQYKCAFCPWRTSTLENVTNHHEKSHPGQHGEVFYFYYREGSVPDELDGTPRWMKQRQKEGVRKGNDDDMTDVKTESAPESAPTETNPVLESLLRQPAQVPIDLNKVKSEVEEPAHLPIGPITIEQLCKQFGQFCEPNGLKYKCPLCNVASEMTADAMQSHLYEELKYRKWACSICSYKAFHKKGLKDHATEEHRQNLEPIELASDVNIETWVSKLLAHQEEIINNQRSLLIQTPEEATATKIQVQSKEPPLPPKEKVSVQEDATKKTSMEDLEKFFGPFGAPSNMQFACPKCDFKVKEDSKMHEHLEMELTAVRWCCSNCTTKFTHYHQAQLHCKSAHAGLSARAIEAVRDAEVRAAWVQAVVKVQKLSMNYMPVADVPAEEPTPSTSKDTPNMLEPLENSLLVVRYEENIPTPEVHPTSRRKRPGFSGDQDSDDERLVIDEETAKEPSAKKIACTTVATNELKCPYCDFKSVYPQSYKIHILRHYNRGAYRCAYCNEFEGYNQAVYRHIEKTHPGKPRKIIANDIPDTPPLLGVVPLGIGARRNEKDDGLSHCLICQEDVLTVDKPKHVHGNGKPLFVKKGDLIVICKNCRSMNVDMESFEIHHLEQHPSEERKFIYYKYMPKKRRSSRKNTDDSFAPETNSNTDESQDESQSLKRKADESALPNSKKVARKSTAKPTFVQKVARKSTSKLPTIDHENDINTACGGNPDFGEPSDNKTDAQSINSNSKEMAHVAANVQEISSEDSS